MSEIPNFVALPAGEAEKDNVYIVGTGDTRNFAVDDLKISGRLENYIAETDHNGDIEIEIWTVTAAKDSDWPEEAIDEGWIWCLHAKLETRVLTPTPEEDR